MERGLCIEVRASLLKRVYEDNPEEKARQHTHTLTSTPQPTTPQQRPPSPLTHHTDLVHHVGQHGVEHARVDGRRGLHVEVHGRAAQVDALHLDAAAAACVARQWMMKVSWMVVCCLGDRHNKPPLQQQQRVRCALALCRCAALRLSKNTCVPTAPSAIYKHISAS